MCQSQAEGGKRCAAHTRPPYADVMTRLKGSNDIERVALAEEGHRAFIDHATTPAGRKELLADRALLSETFEVFPSTSAEQETARQELLASLHLATVQAEIRAEIEDESRRRERYARTGTHAETPAPRDPNALAATGVIDLSTSTIAQWDTVEGLKVVEMDEQCNYCGGKEVPMVDTKNGRTVLPHSARTGASPCVHGTRVGAATVGNTSNLL